jgi:hydrogenase expression/formation protein HypC
MCLAVPGQVQEVYEAHGVRTGKVNFGGVVKEVCLAYVPEVAVGDYALVHVGVAISKVDEQSALHSLKLLAEMGILDEELHDEIPH